MAPPINLNHADLDMLFRHRQQLPQDVEENLTATRQIMAWHPQRFDRPGQMYAQLAGIMAMSTSSVRRRFSHCCIDFKPCGLVKFCPYCAHTRRMKVLKTFLACFGQTPLYFLTISFEGDLSFLPGDALAVEVYWDASVKAVKDMVTEGIFHGAFWSEELALNSMVPLRVLPHIHVIVAADEINLSMLDDLKERILAYREAPCDYFKPDNLDPYWFQVTLAVSTRTYPVRSELDWANILSYMAKTVTLAERYVEEFTATECNPASIAWLNEAVDIFFEQLECCTGIPWARHCMEPRRRPRRMQFGYKGVLDARTKDFLGVRRQKRDSDEHDRLTKAILKDQGIEKALCFEPDWLGQSLEEQSLREEEMAPAGVAAA